MKSRLACIATALLFLQPLAAQYRTALPGYRYEFPRDHFNHPDFQTEWWYYTGNLRAADGRRFGYQLTIFRRALAPRSPHRSSPLATRQVYFAHFAVSDIKRGTFHAAERWSRGADDLAGAVPEPYRVWVETWSVEELPSGVPESRAGDSD